jgi:phosphoenolpyruvate-protein kinase (PTS system EI component)
MGVRDLSMNPFLAKRVRSAISNLTLAQAQAVARSALAAVTPKEIRDVLATGLRDVIA